MQTSTSRRPAAAGSADAACGRPQRRRRVGGSAAAPAVSAPRPGRPRRSTAAAAAAAAAAALDPSRLVVTVSRPSEYFPAADLHAVCFEEHAAGPCQALWQRFERVWALGINDSLVQSGAGSCSLLVAYDPDAAPPELLERARGGGGGLARSGGSSGGEGEREAAPGAPPARLPEGFDFPALGYFLSRTVDRGVWPGLGAAYADLGIVGVAQVDSFGDLIPPRTLDAKRDGAVGWVRREGIAYISNVAVAPGARRRGVAARLMAEAEALAASWGCSRAGLHCNPSNAPAVELYRRLRYRRGALEAPWMPYLQGRAPDRCHLWLKRLPGCEWAPPPQQQQQQQQQQQLKEDQEEQRQREATTAAAR